MWPLCSRSGRCAAPPVHVHVHVHVHVTCALALDGALLPTPRQPNATAPPATTRPLPRTELSPAGSLPR